MLLVRNGYKIERQIYVLLVKSSFSLLIFFVQVGTILILLHLKELQMAYLGP